MIHGLVFKRTPFGFWRRRPFWGRLWRWITRHRHIPATPIRTKWEAFESVRKCISWSDCACGETVYCAAAIAFNATIEQRIEIEENLEATVRIGIPARFPWPRWFVSWRIRKAQRVAA